MKTSTHLNNEKSKHCDAGEVKAVCNLMHNIMFLMFNMLPITRRAGPDDRSIRCRRDLIVGSGR